MAALRAPAIAEAPGRLRTFRNRHAGETIVVCGCGRSLLELPDPGRFLTVGVNDVGRLFQPTYLVVLNPKSQFKKDRFRHVAESRARAVFTQLDPERDLGGLRHPQVVRFALGRRGGTDLSNPDSLPYTRNSPYVALCLAAFLGAKRIGLIGVDFTDHHFFGQSGRHPLARELARIDREYGRLAEALAARGIEVANLSAASRLSALPKVDPSDFLGPGGVDGAAGGGPRLSLVAGAPAGDDETQRPLRIVQVAATHCAGAIWRLHDVINRYTPHTCRTITPGAVTSGRHYPTDLLFRQKADVRAALASADVVHFHNFIDADHPRMAPYRSLLAGKVQVLQYHTEPALLRRAFRGKDPVRRNDLRTLVIAQKHARFYPQSRPVPNVLDIFDPLLVPDDTRALGDGPLKLIYTPTDRKSYPDYRKTCCGKGYRETLPILRKLQAEGLIELTVADSLAWEKLMPLKRRHDVYLDEVVTGGYHMGSLEALSQGLVTIAHLDRETRELLHRLTGDGAELPWYESTLATLERDLRLLCSLQPAAVRALQERSRQWMESRWNPAEMVGHVLRAYSRAEQPAEPPAARATTVDGPDPRHVHVTFRPVRLLPVYHRPAELQKDLLELEGAWRDRQVVIWGTGPSALEAPEVWNDRAVHIGVNGAWHHPRDSFDAYCLSDQRFVREPENRRIACDVPGVRVYLAHMRDVLPQGIAASFVQTLGRDGFCSDLTRGAYHGLSVVWVALQLAFWGGSRDVLLVGCEHDYRRGRPRSYQERRPAPVDVSNWPIIRSNYRRLMPLLARSEVRLRTVGASRLCEAGVPRWTR